MTMPAGNYYIGDLCYVMTDTEWNEVCETMFKGTESGNYGEFELSDGRKYAIYHTAYGDGSYSSNIDTRHCVDSGTIGCILVDDIRADKYENLSDLGAFREFKTEFVTGEDNGVIQFGSVLIDTDPEYYDDGYEDSPV